MFAIYKRELKSYFTGMMGFVILAILFVFFGLYYVIVNVINGNPYFGKSMASMTSYMMIIIPLLTMRCMSEDKKNKTDQILLTAPVSTTKVIMGKYLAMMTIIFIATVYSLIFPILQLFKSSHSLTIDLSTTLAFLFFCAAYVAIGMFISSLTESQIIAAVISFAVFFLMNLMSSLTSYIPETTYINAIGFSIIALLVCLIINHVIRNAYASSCVFIIAMIVIWALYFIKGDIYSGALANVLNVVSFSTGISYFAAGVFDVKTLVMFLSVAVLFVFLTVQSLQKRRWN